MLYAGHQQSIFVRLSFVASFGLLIPFTLHLRIIIFIINFIVKDSPWFKGFGLLEWFIWRSVYLISLGSLRNRAQVPAEWLRTTFILI